MLAFCDAILLGGMGAGNTVRYACALEIAMKAMILTTPVGLHGTNFGVEKTLNMFLKGIENALNIRFVFDQIYPTMTTIIINKANIILKTSKRR